jgi:hypothetical protein
VGVGEAERGAADVDHVATAAREGVILDDSRVGGNG